VLAAPGLQGRKLVGARILAVAHQFANAGARHHGAGSATRKRSNVWKPLHGRKRLHSSVPCDPATLSRHSARAYRRKKLAAGRESCPKRRVGGSSKLALCSAGGSVTAADGIRPGRENKTQGSSCYATVRCLGPAVRRSPAVVSVQLDGGTCTRGGRYAGLALCRRRLVRSRTQRRTGSRAAGDLCRRCLGPVGGVFANSDQHGLPSFGARE